MDKINKNDFVCLRNILKNTKYKNITNLKRKLNRLEVPIVKIDGDECVWSDFEYVLFTRIDHRNSTELSQKIAFFKANYENI